MVRPKHVASDSAGGGADGGGESRIEAGLRPRSKVGHPACRLATLSAMARVTYDSQSFSIDGRRIWVLGGSIHYARVPVEAWSDRIAAAAQAGLNTIETVCPWALHEPRKGRFCFTGQADVRRFVELCAEAGMWVVLRPGPFIADGYDAGGLPAWLIEMPHVALRQANEPFLERVSLYFRKLLNELSGLQASDGGPILLVQSEHAWLCSNHVQADRYLLEITRYIRGNGVNVPIFNTNDLWQESPGTIDTWRGRDDLLLHLRQLRSVQRDAPRLVSAFRAADQQTWGAARGDDLSAPTLLHRLAQVLAAGAQPIVSPFHGGTNFGFLGGRAAGAADRFVATTIAPGAPLGEAGARGPKYNVIRRLFTFARDFSHVFADLDPDYHPVTLDHADLSTAPSSRSKQAARPISVVPLRGAAGRVVFVFSDGGPREATLLLDHGIRLPVNLGDQLVGWYIFDVDLQGLGHLEYANLCPFALVDRSILVLQGPAKASVLLSIGGSSLEATVPTGPKPLVREHKNITIVICNQQQIDETYCDSHAVYIGVGGFDREGSPVPGRGSAPAWKVTKDAGLEKITITPSARTRAALKMTQWEAASRSAHVDGSSPRFATLDGPATLAECGAALGYGWYRIQFKVSSTRKRRLHLPHVADRAHLFLDGVHWRLVGVGRGAQHRPFDLSLEKGQHTLVALVDNLGRFAEGNDLGNRTGFFGHLYDVKPLRSIKPKRVRHTPVDPFALRDYVAGRTYGQLSDPGQLTWTFLHARKTPILVEVDGAEASGTFLINDEPLAYYAGATGGRRLELLIDPATTEAFRRGKNVLRFAPDARQPRAQAEIAAATTLYECIESLTASGTWAYAKWEPPKTSEFEQTSGTTARRRRGAPCWWRTVVTLESTEPAVWFDTLGLSKGQVFVNGNNLGRYFTATADGKAVGPQRWLYVPGSWLEPGNENEILIFDEHGFAPHRTRLVFSATGPLK